MSGKSDKDAADVFAIPFLGSATHPLKLPEDTSSFFAPAPENLNPSVLRPGHNNQLSTYASCLDAFSTKDTENQSVFFGYPQDLILEAPAVSPQTENVPSESELSFVNKDDEFDDWMNYGEIPPAVPAYKTWDLFMSHVSSQQPPLFVTEAGPGAFDAALIAKHDPFRVRNTDYKVINTKTYCACLLALSLGRNSILFSWDKDKRTFLPAIEKSRISGVMAKTLRGLQDVCIQNGNATHFLKRYVTWVYSTDPTPSKVSLATTIDRVLFVIQSVLGEIGSAIHSILHLDSVVRPTHKILIYFKCLVSRVAKANTDEEILTILFIETESQEHGNTAVRDVVREVLWRVSQPWLSFVEEWIGVKAEEGIELSKDGPGKSFVKIENKTWVDDQGFENSEFGFALDQTKMPSFMASDLAQKLFETGKNLRFLKNNHPDHPLCIPNLIASSKPPKLEWHFDWDPIRKIEAAALDYEKLSSSIIREYLTDISYHPAPPQPLTHDPGEFFNFKGVREESEQLLAPLSNFNEPIKTSTRKDRFDEILSHWLRDGQSMVEPDKYAFNPHSSLVPILSFGPLITVQSKLMDRECIRLLFSAHNLRQHLKLQRDFQLMGNGLLSSRLSHALFDPDLETAERHHGVARQGGVMGLRLSGRDTWPPASSELRLALMGVLAECYFPHLVTGEGSGIAFKVDKHKLPGDLSFAVRDLSSDEIDACMDVDSIAALDFLRLSYKAPGPLAPIITPRILGKYDRIFRLLLRVLRMQYVITQLHKDIHGKRSTFKATAISMRFRIEAHHFITALSSYFYDTGIAGPWKSFEHWLNGIEANMACGSADSNPKHVPGPERLREFHERILDQIMLALMLRKRQRPVMKLLEEIFGLILKFGKSIRIQAMGVEKVEDSIEFDVVALYKAFKQKVDVFVTVCRGLSEKGGLGMKTEKELLSDEKSQGGLEENVILRLLVRLEMRNYYAQGQV